MLDVPNVNSIKRQKKRNVRVGYVCFNLKNANNLVLEITMLLWIEENQLV